MASRYGAYSFSRGARSAFNSFRNTSAASQTTRPSRRAKNLFENGSPSMNRRRLAETMIPLHNAVASAKLVSQLSVSSRSSRALSSGHYLQNYNFSQRLGHLNAMTNVYMYEALQGYFYASYQFMPSVRGKSDLPDVNPIL